MKLHEIALSIAIAAINFSVSILEKKAKLQRKSANALLKIHDKEYQDYLDRIADLSDSALKSDKKAIALQNLKIHLEGVMRNGKH